MLACTALVGCTNEDVVNNENEKGQQAYMAVTIVNPVGMNSRGTVGNSEFVNGTANENAVNKVDFYFYDQNGNYLRKGITANNPTGTENTQPNNVEKVYSAVLVLETTENTQPHNVLAVINNSDTDEFIGKSLKDAKTIISNSYLNTSSAFLMTNSSYNGTDVSETFATKIDPATSLFATAEAAKEAPVKIYVERLATKVKVETPANGTANDIPVQSGEGDIKQSTLTINVLGWGLNATNKSSFWIKNINTAWANTDADFFVWNAADYHRSYWAMSPNYLNGIYAVEGQVVPENSSVTYYTPAELLKLDDSGKPVITDGKAESLKLVNDGGNNMVQYCMENTSTSGKLADRAYVTAATHVIVLARIGDGATTYYKYNGVMYDETNYKAAVLRDIQAYHGQIYVDANKTTPLAVTHIAVQAINATDDVTYLNVTPAEQTTKFYKENGAEIAFAAILTETSTNEGATTTTPIILDAEGFNGGMMYYNIPIEHLNGSWYTKDASGKKVYVEDPKEAVFGVVRNHYYQMEVNKIENLGTGIYNPNKPIIPSTDPDKYYLAAELNVLAWHVVSQGVDL